MVILPAVLALTAACGFTPRPLDTAPPPGGAERPGLSPLAAEPIATESLAADAAAPTTAGPGQPTQLAAAEPVPLVPYTTAPPPAAPLTTPPPSAAAAPPAAPNPLDAIFGPSSPPVAAVGPSQAPPAPVAPAPAPARAAARAQADTFPIPFARFFSSGPGRLTLSNFTFDTAQIQAIVTPFADCGLHDGITATDFMLPLNGTRIINAPVGSDVCWRRAVGPGARPGGAPGEPGWTEWSRIFTSTGALVDAQL